jgi:hypothetical protein
MSLQDALRSTLQLERSSLGKSIFGKFAPKEYRPSGRGSFLAWPFFLAQLFALRVVLQDAAAHPLDDDSNRLRPHTVAADGAVALSATSSASRSGDESASDDDGTAFANQIRIQLVTEHAQPAVGAIDGPKSLPAVAEADISGGGGGGGGGDDAEGGSRQGRFFHDHAPTASDFLSGFIGDGAQVQGAVLGMASFDVDVGLPVLQGLSTDLKVAVGDIAIDVNLGATAPLSIALDLPAILGPGLPAGVEQADAISSLHAIGLQAPFASMSVGTSGTAADNAATTSTGSIDAVHALASATEAVASISSDGGEYSPLQDHGMLSSGNSLHFSSALANPQVQLNELFSGSKYTDYNVALHNGTGVPATAIAGTEVATLDDAALHQLALQAVDPGTTGQQTQHDASVAPEHVPIAMEEHSVRALSI